MLKSTRWAWVACVGLAGALTAGADPVAPAKPAVENWLPVPKPREPNEKTECVAEAPPSAFPALALPKPEPSEGEKYDAAFKKLCRRMTTNTALKIEPTDTAPQKVLKSRLQQGVLEYRGHVKAAKELISGYLLFTPPFECLSDIQATVLELWAGQPMELAPWLEELLIVAKEEERYAQLRVKAGATPSSKLNYVTRHRLKVEAELWKIKNVDAKRVEDAVAKKDDPKAKTTDGDWLADKKVPPSLFPGIALPAPDNANDPGGKKRMEQYATLCPRLSGQTGLKIEDGDTVLQKLLKARLHQGSLEMQQHRHTIETGGWSPELSSLYYDCLEDLRSAATELWAKQPKELVPWLEELLVEAKDSERHMQLRVEAGASHPHRLNKATQHRLKVEAELWKAKNAK